MGFPKIRFSIRALLVSLTLASLCFGLLRIGWQRSYREGFYDGLVFRIIRHSTFSGGREDPWPFRPGYDWGFNHGIEAIPYDVFSHEQESAETTEYAQMIITWAKTAQGLDHTTRQTIHRVAQAIIDNPEATISESWARYNP